MVVDELRCRWPGPLPRLDGFPPLRVTVTTPRDQAVLHAQLAGLGYSFELLHSTDAREEWLCTHPDGSPPEPVSFVTLMPFVHRPSFDSMLATVAAELAVEALVVDNTKQNRGAAASRNIGVRALLAEGKDWLIDISPATRLGPAGGLDFLDALRHMPPGRLVVQSDAPVNWHLIAWHRSLFEAAGLWDENFWPVYGEDGDMARRAAIVARHEGLPAAWACVPSDAWVTMYGHSVALAGVAPDYRRIWGYYERKWAGLSGHERYDLPWGDKPLDWWPRPPDPLCSGLMPEEAP